MDNIDYMHISSNPYSFEYPPFTCLESVFLLLALLGERGLSSGGGSGGKGCPVALASVKL